jgi:predicted TPR repeat methyltransferase
MVNLSSGDPGLDRRAEFADALLAGGDAQAAADLQAEIMDLAPHWAAGWFRLGEMQEAAGRLDAACAAFARAEAADPADRLGAGLKRRILSGEAAEAMPAAFVETLFDQYAPRFDAALTQRLAYSVPDRIGAALIGLGLTRASHALDLGCGTGLMAPFLRPVSDLLEGSDLSGGMLAQARARGLYDRLARADATALPVRLDHPDLIVAADVAPYIGVLDGMVAAIAGFCAPEAWLAFSVEAHDGPEAMVLRPSRRFAHSAFYVEDVLLRHDFVPLSIARHPIRLDRGTPIEGYIVVARKRAAPPVSQERNPKSGSRYSEHSRPNSTAWINAPASDIKGVDPGDGAPRV